MAQTTVELGSVIRRFCQQLETMGIEVQRVLLYGSRARGDAEEGSDIDVIVVSSSWAGMNMRERLEILGVAAARILEPIQAHGLTPEEIAEGELSPFWAEVLRTQAMEIHQKI